MKFLFASDSFKGTLSSARIAELLTTAAKESFPDCTCTSIETADGGEGTTDAVLSAVQGQHLWCAGLSGKKQTAFTENWMKNVQSWKWRQHPVFHC